MIPNPSPSSTRKSERLEKRTLTPTFKRKSQRIEKKGMPSLLRRSDKGKKLSRVNFFWALFKEQPKKVITVAALHGEQTRLNNFSQGGSSNCVGEIDGGDECNKRKEELREESFGRTLVGSDSWSGDGDGIEVSQSGDSLSSYDAMAKEMSDNPERVQGIIPLIRKRKSVEMDVDAYAIIASKDTCIPIADAISSSPPACERNDLVETCGTCFKRQRYL
uniref:Uncharacterized protein n=1 Tax=Fagus sylvatica TaxID=28930 RepID=A0A2N9HI30_FAGSY